MKCPHCGEWIEDHRGMLFDVGESGPSGYQLSELWNQVVPFNRVLRWTQARGRALKARSQEQFFRDNWRDAMEEIREIPFLCGENSRGWKASLDWFLKPDSVISICEGKYTGAVVEDLL